MREKLLMTDSVIKNKITGKFYLVTAITEDSFTVQEVTDERDRTSVTGDLIDIPKKNVILYRFIHDVSEPSLPDYRAYSIVNGQIVMNGKPITAQGQLTFEKIIGAVNDTLVLSAKENEIYIYNIRRDSFKCIFSTSTCLDDEDDDYYDDDEDECNDFSETDNNSKKPAATIHELTVISSASPFIAVDNTFGIKKDKNGNDNKIFTGAVLLAGDSYVHMTGFKDQILDVEADDDAHYVVATVDDDGVTMYTLLNMNMSRIYKGELHITGCADVNGYSTMNFPGGVIVNATVYKVPELENLFAVDKIDHDLVFTDKTQEVLKKLHVDQTPDRGPIYTVTDM
jgi:hypothetical protein